MPFAPKSKADSAFNRVVRPGGVYSIPLPPMTAFLPCDVLPAVFHPEVFAEKEGLFCNMNQTITREADWELLTEFTQSESLRKHALAVEACMRACSRKYGDGSPDAENLWGLVGLIHDFDYERWPSLEDHPYKGNEILKERGYSDEIRRAIMSHAEYSGVTRDTPMEKCLFACDELAGFITAVALIKP